MLEKLCPKNSLCPFPDTSLARLVSLQFGPSDNVFLQYFGLLAAKDRFASQGATKTV